VGTGTTSFRRLVSAFHDDSKYLGPEDQGNQRLSQKNQASATFLPQVFQTRFLEHPKNPWAVDKFLIKSFFAVLF
jgi:hypothetical protein